MLVWEAEQQSCWWWFQMTADRSGRLASLIVDKVLGSFLLQNVVLKCRNECAGLSSYQLGVTHRHHCTVLYCISHRHVQYRTFWLYTWLSQVQMNYSFYQVQGYKEHGWGGQQVGMDGSGRMMAMMEVPGHTYSLLRWNSRQFAFQAVSNKHLSLLLILSEIFWNAFNGGGNRIGNWLTTPPGREYPTHHFNNSGFQQSASGRCHAVCVCIIIYVVVWSNIILVSSQNTEFWFL